MHFLSHIYKKNRNKLTKHLDFIVKNNPHDLEMQKKIQEQIDLLDLVRRPFPPQNTADRIPWFDDHDEKKMDAIKRVFSYCNDFTSSKQRNLSENWKEDILELYKSQSGELYVTEYISKKINPYRYKKAEKKNITFRCIQKPNDTLKSVQKCLLEYLEKDMTYPKNIFGFVPKRSHYVNARFHAQQKPKKVLSIDIKNFFETTTQFQLRPALRSFFEQKGDMDSLDDIELLIDGLLYLTTSEVKFNTKNHYQKTELILLSHYFSHLINTNNFPIRGKIKILSQGYERMFKRIRPKSNITLSLVEQVISNLYKKSALTFDSFTQSIIDWFQDKEPYSFPLFYNLRDVVVLGSFFRMGFKKSFSLTKESICEYAFRLIKKDVKSVKRAIGFNQNSFNVGICLYQAQKKDHQFINSLSILNEEEKKQLKSWFLQLKNSIRFDDWIQLLFDLPKITKESWKELSFFIFNKNDVFKDNRNEVLYFQYLPQGAPTSPLLSNLAFRQLDKKLELLSIKNRLLYSRYADDLTFSGADIPAQFIGDVARVLEDGGYRINREKTSIRSYYQHQEVNGLLINDGNVRISRKYYMWVRAEIYFLSMKILEINNYKLRKRILEGHLSYIKSVDQAKYQRLVSYKEKQERRKRKSP